MKMGTSSRCLIRMISFSGAGFTKINGSGIQPWNRNNETKALSTSVTSCQNYILPNFYLESVGKVQPRNDNPQEFYKTGQMFLHQVFNYRGVILFPWETQLYDRDIPPSPKGKPKEKVFKKGSFGDKLSKDKSEKERITYYVVMIDSRDKNLISNRHEYDYVRLFGGTPEENFLSNLNTKDAFDYVSYEDIVPYDPDHGNENVSSMIFKAPIVHDLFDTFLVRNDVNSTSSADDETDKSKPVMDYIARPNLEIFRLKYLLPMLELSAVHRETTEEVRITAIPFYMFRRNPESYFWRYCIRIENLGEKTVHLRKRHWRIFNRSGTLMTVNDNGVMGTEPIIRQGECYQYSSSVELAAPEGHMWGSFKMEREDGITFDCRIPPFSLDSLDSRSEN